jgi:hypothetical protein
MLAGAPLDGFDATGMIRMNLKERSGVTRPTRGLRSGRDRRLDTPESATYPIAPGDHSPRARPNVSCDPRPVGDGELRAGESLAQNSRPPTLGECDGDQSRKRRSLRDLGPHHGLNEGTGTPVRFRRNGHEQNDEKKVTIVTGNAWRKRVPSRF